MTKSKYGGCDLGLAGANLDMLRAIVQGLDDRDDITDSEKDRIREMWKMAEPQIEGELIAAAVEVEEIKVQ